MAAVRAPSLETILNTSSMENVRLRIRLHSAAMADFVGHHNELYSQKPQVVQKPRHPGDIASIAWPAAGGGCLTPTTMEPKKNV